MHELAHQWYGDTVTPDDWRDVWMNEGMAMYLQGMWEAEQAGITIDQQMDEWAKFEDGEREFAGPPADYDLDKFGSGNIYYGPALMWHELRQQIGDESVLRRHPRLARVSGEPLLQPRDALPVLREAHRRGAVGVLRRLAARRADATAGLAGRATSGQSFELVDRLSARLVLPCHGFTLGKTWSRLPSRRPHCAPYPPELVRTSRGRGRRRSATCPACDGTSVPG